MGLDMLSSHVIYGQNINKTFGLSAILTTNHAQGQNNTIVKCTTHIRRRIYFQACN